MALAAWARAVVVIVGASVAPALVGLGAAAGFAVIPGIYMALGPPVGPLGERVRTVLGATLLVVAAIALGAALSGSTLTITAGLMAVAFAGGLLPRLGPRWAALQLPVLMAFAYSAAFPLDEASLAARTGAVLAATPVYLLAAALLFQTDARRPLLLGAAAAFGGVADAVEHAAAGVEGAAGEAERGLVAFRVATGRLKMRPCPPAPRRTRAPGACWPSPPSRRSPGRSCWPARPGGWTGRDGSGRRRWPRPPGASPPGCGTPRPCRRPAPWRPRP